MVLIILTQLFIDLRQEDLLLIWIRGPWALLLWSLEQKALGSDIIVAEGSMGLYDGVLKQGVTGFGSSAETAMFFGWPVILVIDVSGQAQSAAATAFGSYTIIVSYRWQG